MVLAWKQPTFIGGADITGYFVDYREVIDGVPGKWHEANIKAVSERAYRVSGWKIQPKYRIQLILKTLRRFHTFHVPLLSGV